MITEVQQTVHHLFYTQSIEDIDLIKYRNYIVDNLKKDGKALNEIPLLLIANGLIFSELYELCNNVSNCDNTMIDAIGYDEDEDFFIKFCSIFFIFNRPKCESCKTILYNTPLIQEWCKDCEADILEEKKYEAGYNSCNFNGLSYEN